MEHLDFISILQAGGTPVMGLVGYFLWRLSQQMTELKVSIDTLVSTLIRFVPGIKENSK
jgi:hypothetical protein